MNHTPYIYINADKYKAKQLRKMRLFAAGLLLLMAIIYLFCLHYERAYQELSYVAAFTEAAIIGALADWFAVTALFRYPLGVPIPHTAIIPRNKQRIANSLGRFIETNFLSAEQLIESIDKFNPARRLAIWLARSGSENEFTKQLSQIVFFILENLNSQRFSSIAHKLIQKTLSCADFSNAAALFVQSLCEKGYQQQFLNGVLHELLQKLESAPTQQYLATLISKELSVLRWISLDDAGGRYMARKIVSAAILELEHAMTHPEHTLRKVVDQRLIKLSEDLQQNLLLRQKIELWRDEILQSDTLQKSLNGVWHALLVALQQDLSNDSSQIRQQLNSAVKQFGLRLRKDGLTTVWLNQQISKFAVSSILLHRNEIGSFIADQLKSWDDAVLVRRMELSVGVDLQFIRINGTLVGGLIGLLIYSARHWFGY